jgi:cysteine sulfinate desulfinase/cysteine desulfurase-like protein
LIGQKAADAVAQARTEVANLVATEPERIIFTSPKTSMRRMEKKLERTALIGVG